MTLEELQRVRELTLKLAAVERSLQALKDSRARITSVIDGLPKAKDVKSRLETLSVLIVDAENEYSRIDNELVSVTTELERKIRKEFTNYTEQLILLLRYIYCYDFFDIAMASGYSERRIYKIHSKILSQLKNPVGTT